MVGNWAIRFFVNGVPSPLGKCLLYEKRGKVYNRSIYFHNYLRKAKLAKFFHFSKSRVLFVDLTNATKPIPVHPHSENVKCFCNIPKDGRSGMFILFITSVFAGKPRHLSHFACSIEWVFH